MVGGNDLFYYTNCAEVDKLMMLHLPNAYSSNVTFAKCTHR